MSKIPKDIKVGYKTYKVREWLPKEILENALHGECSHVLEEIRYMQAGSMVETKNTLLHEVFHACFKVYGLSEDFDDEEGEKLEEKVITVIANSLMQVIQDNPEFTKFVFEEQTPKED